MSDDNLTPMMRQYMEVKAEAPSDALLLFRMGDFYEMFFDDAKRGSAVFDIALTQRQGVAMCGIPHHALDVYLPRAVEAGVKVAIADQMEDPKLAKGIVKRALTRVITPGTLMDGALLDPSRGNYLAAVCPAPGGGFGFALLELSIGDFLMAQLESRQALENELGRIAPRECLASESILAEWDKAGAGGRPGHGLPWSPVEDWTFLPDMAADVLKKHFGVASLDGFGAADAPAGVLAAGAALRYALRNLRGQAAHVLSLKCYSTSDFMTLDAATRRNLELVEPAGSKGKAGSLLGVLDHTKTPMGGRLLREWILKPLVRKDRINGRLGALDDLLYDPLTLAELRETFASVRDLERILVRVSMGTAGPRDVNALALGLEAMPGVSTLLAGFGSPLLADIRSRVRAFPELTALVRQAIVDEPPAFIADGGVIREGFDARLDELRRAATDGKDWIAALQAKEQERTGIKTLKIKYNRVFGYFIEVTRTNLERVPDDYCRKQTVANAERYITPDLKEMEDKILGAEDKSKALEQELFQAVRARCAEDTAAVRLAAAAIAEADALAGLAEAARVRGYVRPEMLERGGLISIKAGRHPVLDAAMTSERFVPNDVELNDEARLAIITGPNMAGKSTYIRQAALLVLMAQAGSYVPADSARIGVVDRVFTRVGASDDLARGQSTFMVEMVETANILANATRDSLVVLDEIGRGTSTFDGLSLAWAIAEQIHDLEVCGAKTLFATHYHELTELAITCPAVRNYNVAVKEYGDDVVFLRQIIPGAADKSYGIHVAKLAGLPPKVLDRAKEILHNLESHALSASGEPVIAETQRPAPAGRRQRAVCREDFHPTLL